MDFDVIWTDPGSGQERKSAGSGVYVSGDTRSRTEGSMFLTFVKWSQPGAQSRATLINNLHVVAPSAFVSALTDLIRGWSAMKYSQTNPDRTWYRDNGYGQLNWQDGPVARSQNVQFYFTPSEWVKNTSVVLTMLAVA